MAADEFFERDRYQAAARNFHLASDRPACSNKDSGSEIAVLILVMSYTVTHTKSITTYLRQLSPQTNLAPKWVAIADKIRKLIMLLPTQP